MNKTSTSWIALAILAGLMAVTFLGSADALTRRERRQNFRIHQLETTVGNLQSRVSNLETTVGNHSSRLTALETQNTNQAAKLSKLDTNGNYTGHVTAGQVDKPSACADGAPAVWRGTTLSC